MNFKESLAAILIGNLIYFLLMPRLPAAARHGLYSIDLGLLVDFLFCIAVWGFIHLLTRRRARKL